MHKGSNKGIAYLKLVSLIIAAVFLIILILYIENGVELAQYEESIVMCNQFFESINGKPLYFGEDLDNFTPKLTEISSNLCSSKTVEVSSRNVKPALDLMKDCWFKTGSGVDIFPLIAKDMKLCFYCGTIKSDGEIGGFKKKIKEELKEDEYSTLLAKDAEILNLNYATFESSIPDTFADDRELSVFYYAYKPPVEITGKLGEDLKLWGKDVVNRGLRDFVGENMDIGPSLNYYVLDEYMVGELVRTSGGVVLVSQEETQEQDFEDIKNMISTRDCYVIYPIKNYD